jgi:NADH-quinone oxidoreductase subunit A
MFLQNSLLIKDYFILLLLVGFVIFLTLFITSSSYLLAMQNPESEKLSIYECGFEPYEDARHTFNIRFCVVAILFIIFDIEMMFLAPWCVSVSKVDLLSFWSMIDFLFELNVGFFYVWYVGTFDWN